MRRVALAIAAVVALCLQTTAQTPAAGGSSQVDMELMTYPEVAASMNAGKTTVLIYDGGTEQRGPHAVLGGHTLIARRAGVDIARRLGNALVGPVLPFSIAGSHLNPRWPGSVNLPAPVFTAVNEAIVDSMVVNGFTHVILMGDHGGGQAELRALARRLDAKYAPKGTRVLFCADVYEKTRRDVDAYISAHHLPPTTHGGVHDTSVLMYLGGDRYVRKDKLVAGDPVAGGQAPERKVDNGITGDPRPSTPELGKVFYEMQVSNAVADIARLVTAAPVRR
jgi:creatinine amidohydrolase/Fe(II)-dependent formamide hydrolase-like protein